MTHDTRDYYGIKVTKARVGYELTVKWWYRGDIPTTVKHTWVLIGGKRRAIDKGARKISSLRAKRGRERERERTAWTKEYSDPAQPLARTQPLPARDVYPSTLHPLHRG